MEDSVTLLVTMKPTIKGYEYKLQKYVQKCREALSNMFFVLMKIWALT